MYVCTLMNVITVLKAMSVVNAEMRKGAVMQKMSIVIETAWAQGKGNGVSTGFLHTAFVQSTLWGLHWA
jgi:hypothetical protein